MVDRIIERDLSYPGDIAGVFCNVRTKQVKIRYAL